MRLKDNLFVYGTLGFPAMMQAVLGRTLPARDAVLHGYCRYQVRKRVFPAIVPCPHGCVHGRLFAGVAGWMLERIDDYEGPPYRRERVTVLAGDDGGPVDAVTYVLRPRYRPLLLDHDWDPDEFARRWHDWYVRQFETLYGTDGRTRS